MKTTEVKGKIFPGTLFLYQDDDGNYHWFRNDPMKIDKREMEEIPSIEDVIADWAGQGDIANPIMFRFATAKINRCSRYTMTLPDDIRNGKLNMHIQDMTGRVVEVTTTRNPDPSYPLNGIVFDRTGAMLAMRTYSTDGRCSDLDPDHNLIGVAGPAVFGQEEDN